MDWNVAITFVIDNVDRDLCYLLGNGAGRRECSSKVGEYLARLSDQISRPDQLPSAIAFEESLQLSQFGGALVLSSSKS